MQAEWIPGQIPVKAYRKRAVTRSNGQVRYKVKQCQLFLRHDITNLYYDVQVLFFGTRHHLKLAANHKYHSRDDGNRRLSIPKTTARATTVDN